MVTFNLKEWSYLKINSKPHVNYINIDYSLKMSSK